MAVVAAVEESDGASTAGSTITPRRGLPTGRAVVGALLITVAAVGSFALASGGEKGPTTSFLVVVRPVRAGEPITSGDLELAPLELTERVAATAVAASVDVDETVALRDLRPGQLLSIHDVAVASHAGGAALGPVHELSFPVPLQRIDRGLVPGDRVTVLATLRVDDAVQTIVAVEDAVVLSWDTSRDTIGAASAGVLTLALDHADEVIETTHLVHEGDVTVVRTTRALDDTYPDAYTVGSTPTSSGDEPAGPGPDTGTGS